MLVLTASIFCSAHSTAPGCPKGDVLVKIVEPTMKDIFIQRKGQLLCQVTVLKQSVTGIWWEDESGNKLVALSPTTNGKSIVTLPLDITYDEWSQGTKLFCFVEHSDWLEPLKERYERRSGKNVSILISHQRHCHL